MNKSGVNSINYLSYFSLNSKNFHPYIECDYFKYENNPLFLNKLEETNFVNDEALNLNNPIDLSEDIVNPNIITVFRNRSEAIIQTSKQALNVDDLTNF